MSQAPAGWQPDPRGRHEYRYWDGDQWTDHVADQGQVSSDPVADESPPQQEEASQGPAERRDAPQPERTEEQPAASATPSDEVPNYSGVTIGSAGSSEAPAQDSSEEAPAQDSSPESSFSSEQRGSSAPPDSQASAPAGGSAPAGTTPSTPQTDAKVAAQGMLKSKSLDLGTILSVVAPGSGHFYVGTNKVPIAAGLLGATVVAVVLAYFSFLLFLLGFVIWAAAAAFAVSDLRGSLKGVESTSLPKEVLGILMLVAGVVLVISLFLPWYHVKTDFPGRSAAGTFSGFGALSIIDLVLLVIGLAAIVAGAALLELGPLSSAQMPDQMPMVVAGAAAVAVILVLFRMFVDTVGIGDISSASGGSVDQKVGRAPGILLALDAGLIMLIANAGALRSATNR